MLDLLVCIRRMSLLWREVVSSRNVDFSSLGEMLSGRYRHSRSLLLEVAGHFIDWSGATLVSEELWGAMASGMLGRKEAESLAVGIFQDSIWNSKVTFLILQISSD